MPSAQNHNQSSRDVEAGLKTAGETARKAADSVKLETRSVKNIRRNAKQAKKALEKSTKALKKTAEASKKAGELLAKGLQALLANPIGWVILIVLSAVLICVLLMPESTANEPDALTDEDAWNRSMEKACDETEKAINSAYQETQEEAQDKLNQYVKDNYGDGDDVKYVETVIFTENVDTVASDICPYILAMNGTLQYYLDIGNLDEGFRVKNETEYNTLGSGFRNAIQKYAENDLFTISDASADVEKKPMEFPLLDIDGEQKKDEGGNLLTEWKDVWVGTVSVSVNYDISGYKADDFADAVDRCREDHPDLEDAEIEEYMNQYLSEMLYSITGTFEYGTHGGMPGAYLNAEDVGFEGSVGFLEPFGENANGTSLWQVIRQDADAGYFRLANTGDLMQCTNFADWACWKYHGFGTADHPGRNGNGKEVADNLVKYFPDKFRISNSPAPGAVFSTWDTRYTDPRLKASAHMYGHVGIIVKVEGEYIWECDGNTYMDGQSHQIAVNRKWRLSDFEAEYLGSIIYAVPVG